MPAKETRRCPVCALDSGEQGEDARQQFETSSPKAMRRHLLVAHSVGGQSDSQVEDSGNYRCVECKRGFSRHWNLERHQLLVHKWTPVTNRKPWSRHSPRCTRPDSDCKYPSLGADSRGRESDKVDDFVGVDRVRPLECPQCDERCANTVTMWNHIRRVHVQCRDSN